MGNARRLKITSGGSVDFLDSDNTNYVRLQAASTVASNITYTLPATDAAGFLRSDGNGVLTVTAGTATLQEVYSSGHDATLSTGNTGIDIIGPAGLTEPIIHLSQAGANAALQLTQTGNSCALYIVQTYSDQSGIISSGSIQLTNNHGLVIENLAGVKKNAVIRNASNQLVIGDDNQAGNIIITADSTSEISFCINSVEKAVLDLNGNIGIGTDPVAKLDILQADNTIGLRVTKNGTGGNAAFFVSNNGTGSGTRIDQIGNGVGLYIDKSGTGAGSAIYIDNDGTGIGLEILQNSTGAALDITNEGTNNTCVIIKKNGTGSGSALSLASYGTGYCLYLLQGGSGHVILADNGAYLSYGGEWTDASSREYKNFYGEIDSKECLDKLLNLTIRPYTYKKAPNEYHIGPCSEDFYELFSVGDDKGISPLDIASTAVIAIKAIVSRLNELEAKLEAA